LEAVASPSDVEDFLKLRKKNTGSERSNFQSFMRDLYDLLGLPRPEPGDDDSGQNAYVFERLVAPQRADSTTEKRYISIYRHDCFVLEGKQSGKELVSRSHHNAAGSQEERYVRGLPQKEVEHGRPSLIAEGRAAYEETTNTWHAIG